MITSVSVIIPTYNRARLVRRAIESALAQDPRPQEIIVADDGSDDETEQAVLGLSDSIRYLRLPHSGLPAVARNAGLAVAQASYVAFLDSDDTWLPGKLKRQLGILEASPDVVLVATNAMVIGSDCTAAEAPLHHDLADGPVPLEKLLAGNIIVASSVLARREVIAAAGGFNEDPCLRAVEDYDLWLRLARLGEIRYLAEPLVAYMEHGDSIRSEQSRQAYFDALGRIFAGLRAFRPDRPWTTSERDALDNAERMAAFALMDVAWRNKDPRPFLRHPWRAAPWLLRKICTRLDTRRRVALERR